jgi:3-hydroxybutyrate dehydrogenase
MSLASRNVVITGSNSRGGLAIARAFAKEGCNVFNNVLAGTAAIEAERAAIEKEFGVVAIFDRSDISTPEGVGKLITHAEQALGSVDILLHSAGTEFSSPIEELPTEKWNAIVAASLSSAFHAVRAAIPGMKTRKWGRIINVAPAHSLAASPFKSAHVAAMHGVAGLAKAAAFELAAFGVTVNCILPSNVEASGVDEQISGTMKSRGVASDQAVRGISLAATPSQQNVTFDQVAAMAVFLSSDAASQITGAIISLDSGGTAE